MATMTNLERQPIGNLVGHESVGSFAASLAARGRRNPRSAGRDRRGPLLRVPHAPVPNRDREYGIAHRVGVLIQIAVLRDDRACDRLARPLTEPPPSAARRK